MIIAGARRLTGSILPALFGVLTGLLVLAPFAGAAPLSAEARLCGASPNVIEAEIKLAHARDVWVRFPAMLKAPELEADDRPATLVVFAGDFDTSAVGAAGNGRQKPKTLEAVVCVVQADGTLNLYHDVSRVGSNLSP